MSVFAVIKRRKPSIFSEFPVPSGVGTSLGQAGTKRGCENPMKNVSIALFIMFAMAGGALGQRKPLRQMERLSRGVVAVNEGDGKVFVGWRMFGTDPENIAFDLYRAAGASKAVKLNGRPICRCYVLYRRQGRPHQSQYLLCPAGRRQKRTGGRKRFYLKGRHARPAISVDPAADAGRLHAQRCVGRRSGRRRRVRDRPASGRPRPRQFAGRHDRSADPAGVQTRRHAALDDQPRQKHPRRRALHAVHGL